MLNYLYSALMWLYKHVEDLICGWFTAALCYFFEIKGAIHVMLIIIAFDLIAGITASVWRRKESFSMEKFFLAVGRAFVFTSFVLLLYAVDREMHQQVAASYYIAAWIISGGYLWSFLKNGDTIFGGRIFKMLQGFLRKEVQEKTGVDIAKEE